MMANVESSSQAVPCTNDAPQSSSSASEHNLQQSTYHREDAPTPPQYYATEIEAVGPTDRTVRYDSF